ncbi:hypothetical protein LCGC14_1639720, partial [marine sediment metagenome]
MSDNLKYDPLYIYKTNNSRSDAIDNILSMKMETDLGKKIVSLIKELIETDNEVDHRADPAGRGAAAAHEVVDVVHPLADLIPLLPAFPAGDDHGPAIGQSAQERTRLTYRHPGTLSHLPSSGRVPDLGERQIHFAFRRRQGVEVALEVLGVVIHQ